MNIKPEPKCPQCRMAGVHKMDCSDPSYEQWRKEQQSERARVAKFMGCSIDKVVRGRDGGWTTR